MIPPIGLLFAILGFVQCVEIPPYLTRCNQEEIGTCGPDSANKLLSVILKGEPKYGIPSFFPFRLGETDIDEPGLKFSLKNCELHGFESLHIYEIGFKWPFGTAAMIFDKLSLTGEFTKGAQLFDAVLNRPGVANFTLSNVKVRMVVLFKREKINEEQSRFIAFRYATDIDPESTYYTFNEFYTGVPFLALENSEAITRIILPKFESALKKGYEESGQRIHNFISAETHFLSSQIL